MMNAKHLATLSADELRVLVRQLETQLQNSRAVQDHMGTLINAQAAQVRELRAQHLPGHQQPTDYGK